MFLEKTSFFEFSIHELLSLLKIHSITTKNIFEHEGKIDEHEYPFLSPSRFKNYPYVFLNIEPTNFPTLKKVLERSVTIIRFMHVLGFGETEIQFQNDLHSNIEAIKPEILSKESFCLDVKSHKSKLTPIEKEDKIQNLKLPNFQGKCEMSQPERVFIIIENCDLGGALKGKYLVKSLFNIRKVKPFFSPYNLSDRIFLGPTSTIAELAFMMCNQGLVTSESIVFDPFVGTGSILVSASHFGAKCFGTDIDIRVLQGYAVGKVNKNSSYFTKLNDQIKNNVFLNFRQYELELPEILRADCGEYRFRYSEFFDAIVCDPPYGIRAAAKQTSKESDQNDQIIEKKENYIIPTAKSSCLELTNKLFSLANENLKPNGHLVFLYPVLIDDDPFENFKNVKNFELIAATKNRLCNNNFSRYLFTFRKTGSILMNKV